MIMSTSFIKTTFNTERGEFDRVAKDFSGESAVAFSENKKALERFYSKSNLTELTDIIWKNLENTDSYAIHNLDDIKKAIMGNFASSGSRDVESVIKEFLSGSVRAPIILCYNSNKNYTLVAGNTRLMVARMLRVKPKCVFIKTDW